MKLFTCYLLTAFTFFLASSSPASAQDTGKTVDGMEIFYGVVPAQLIGKQADKHDPKMHGGRSAFRGSQHLVVAVFDTKTGQRINDASIVAAVTPLGMGPTEKKLEPMLINDTTTYGNFFDFPASSAPFRIALKIMRPSIPANAPVTAEFEYRPPGTPAKEPLAGSHSAPASGRK